MKHILLREGIIWQALRQEKSSEFDVLWEILQSSRVQGYITAEDLEVLYHRIACDQDDNVAAKLINKFCRVLKIYSETGDCFLDAAIAEDGLPEVSVSLYDTPLLSVSGFIKRYALYELYETNRQTFQAEGWYRKWRAAEIDPLLIIPLVLTLIIQNLSGFNDFFANLSDGSFLGFDPFSPMKGDCFLTAEMASPNKDTLTQQHLAKTINPLNFSDSAIVKAVSSDRHLLIALSKLDLTLGGGVLSAIPKIFDASNNTILSLFNLIVFDSSKLKISTQIAYPNQKISEVLYSQAQIPVRLIARSTGIPKQSIADIITQTVNPKIESLKTSINTDGQSDSDNPRPDSLISALADRPTLEEGEMLMTSISIPTSNAEVVADSPVIEVPMSTPVLTDAVTPESQMPEGIFILLAKVPDAVTDVSISEDSITSLGSTQELASEGQVPEETPTIFVSDVGVNVKIYLPEESIATPASDDQELDLEAPVLEESVSELAPGAGNVTDIPTLADTTPSARNDNLSTDSQIPSEYLTVSESTENSLITGEAADYLDMTDITNVNSDLGEQSVIDDPLAGLNGVSVNELSDLNLEKSLLVLEPTIAFTNIDLLTPNGYDLGGIIVGEVLADGIAITNEWVDIHSQIQVTDNFHHQIFYAADDVHFLTGSDTRTISPTHEI